MTTTVEHPEMASKEMELKRLGGVVTSVENLNDHILATQTWHKLSNLYSTGREYTLLKPFAHNLEPLVARAQQFITSPEVLRTMDSKLDTGITLVQPYLEKAKPIYDKGALYVKPVYDKGADLVAKVRADLPEMYQIDFAMVWENYLLAIEQAIRSLKEIDASSIPAATLTKLKEAVSAARSSAHFDLSTVAPISELWKRLKAFPTLKDPLADSIPSVEAAWEKIQELLETIKADPRYVTYGKPVVDKVVQTAAPIVLPLKERFLPQATTPVQLEQVEAEPETAEEGSLIELAEQIPLAETKVAEELGEELTSDSA